MVVSSVHRSKKRQECLLTTRTNHRFRWFAHLLECIAWKLLVNSTNRTWLLGAVLCSLAATFCHRLHRNAVVIGPVRLASGLQFTEGALVTSQALSMSLTSCSIRGCAFSGAATISLLFSNLLPAPKSIGLPSRSVTLPPDSSKMRKPPA
jgi:hypothetical protein